MNQFLQAALQYVRRGRLVLPTHPLDNLEDESGNPTQSAEAIVAKAKAERLATLDSKAFDWIARGREANIELGRVFNEIKDILEHGSWEGYFAEKFAPRGIALRTAQLYMRMASEADAVSKNANSALFPPATDPQAQAISDATENARAAVIANGQSPETSRPRSKERVRLDGIYRLPLYMIGEDKDATDELLKSQNWYYAEIEILALLKQLHIKYGIVNDAAADETLAASQANRRLEIIPEGPEANTYAEAADAAHIGNAPEENSEYGDVLA